jgi:hypothetical protein
MKDELERIWKEKVVAEFLRYYPGIRLEGLRNATENLSQDSRFPGLDFFNPGPSECESGVLITRPRCSVTAGTTSNPRTNIIECLQTGKPIYP